MYVCDAHEFKHIFRVLRFVASIVRVVVVVVLYAPIVLPERHGKVKECGGGGGGGGRPMAPNPPNDASFSLLLSLLLSHFVPLARVWS